MTDPLQGDAALEIPQTREKCYVAVGVCGRDAFEKGKVEIAFQWSNSKVRSAPQWLLGFVI